MHNESVYILINEKNIHLNVEPSCINLLAVLAESRRRILKLIKCFHLKFFESPGSRLNK